MKGVLFSQARVANGAAEKWLNGERALASHANVVNRYVLNDDPTRVALVQEGDITPLAGDDTLPETSRYALQEVTDTGAVSSPHRFLLVVAFSVPPEFYEDVEAWYNDEHIGLLMKADGWLRARRFHPKPPFVGPTWTTVALHELRDLETLDSEARRIARSTPWRARLASQPWFENNGRWVYRRL